MSSVIGKNRPVLLAFIILVLTVFAVFAAPTLLLQLSFTNKKIGVWIGDNRSGTATSWAGQVFNGPAKYSIAQVQTGVGGATGTTADMDKNVVWAKDFGVAARSFDDGKVEISIIHAFGGAVDDEAAWTHFQNTVVPTLKSGQPQIKYIGIENEFACHANSGCPRTTWFNDNAYRKTFYDRLKSIIEPQGFEFLGYGQTFADPAYRTVRFTTFPTWGDPAVLLNPASYSTTEYVGAEIGVWASNVGGHGGNGQWDGSYTDSCDCFWAQYIVNGLIDNWRLRTNQNGHFLFLAGPTVNMAQKDGIVWDSTFQQWIMTRQSLYSDFTWIGKSGSVTPPPPPPPASLTTSFDYQASGRNVTFTGSASGGTSPYTYAWNFGDGTTGAGGSTSHNYASDGSYTVTMTAQDSTGTSQTSTGTLSLTTSTTESGTSTGGGGGAGAGYPSPLEPVQAIPGLPSLPLIAWAGIGTAGILGGLWYFKRRKT